jgi:hypothetical protein
MLIILLHGPMGSGKSTLAAALHEQCAVIGRFYTVLPFAKPLKDVAKYMGWNGEKDEKGRRLLQLIGTECGRKCIDPEIWVKKWLKAVEGASLDHDVVVCDDLRFHNEYQVAKTLVNHKVITIKLKGRGYQVKGWWRKLIWNIKRWLGLLHLSEMPLPDSLFDVILDNSKDLSMLDLFAASTIKGHFNGTV